MSSPPGGPPRAPEDSPGKRLRERVNFFERMWGRQQQPAPVPASDPNDDNPTYQETYTSTTHEGDLTTGAKTVKFEKVTVKKTVRHVTSSSTSSTSVRQATTPSRTPSTEGLLEDSAYATHASKTSSTSSLRFPSDERLDWDPKEWERDSDSSKVTSSSSEWYNEYRTHSFHTSGSPRFELVRSKSQYDEHIQHIRDEQERVQKKTFVNWINSYLSKRVPPLKIEDLIEDLKDGTKLLALLEVLSGERLPVERGRVLRRPHFLSNVNTALQFLTSKRIKLVNINASDLVDGRPPVVLGLIWTIILYFQIEENRRQLEYLTQWGSTSSLESAGTTSSKDRWKQGARKTLLQWVSNALPQDSGVEVRDFGASWRDGVAFLAIIDAIKKNLVNIAEMKKASNRARLETAFDVAENELGITRLLDPEDVDVPKPDEKSIMTYVAQFLHKYPEPKSTGPDAVATIQEEFNELHAWLLKNTDYLERLDRTNQFPMDYGEYAAFKAQAVEHEAVYVRLNRLIESQSIISIAKESWAETTKLWNKLQLLMYRWLWLLDATLPGDFRFVGEWLSRAEQLLYFDEIPKAMNEETAAIISRKLEEHKSFFADLPMVQQKFAQAMAAAREVPSQQQLNNMAQRLNQIGPKAVQRRVRLKFLEHKCCLIAFLQLTETKLKAWTAKYGRVDRVIQLLEQYRNFVSKNHIFQEFNKAYIDMQAVIEEYKRDGNIDKKEIADIDRFMRDIGERWKNVSMELRCVQSMLEEVVAYWRRWDSLADEFDAWLVKAEQAMGLPEEDKMEFFQDISVWRDNYQLLGDTVSFLIATCEDQIALELKDRYQAMTDKWNRIYPHVNKYSHAGDILRNRKSFRAGVEVLSNWLRKAESILGEPSLGSMERIKQHTDNLTKLQSEVEEIENLFKNISKAFQTMISDLSREDVDKMMNTLKHEKEALVKVRALIPAQIHLYNQLLVQQESLEAGQKEINAWLDGAEKLLSSLALEGDKEQLKEEIDRVKQFFGRTLYYKSMLDSKNKVMNNIVKSVDQANNTDVATMTAKMDQLNDRFEYVTQNAQLWEQRLQEAVRCWYNFSECEKVISNWLNRAEKLTMEKRIDNKETVEEHKNFFQSVNERWIHDLIQSAQDLCNCLPKDQHSPILGSVDQLQRRWKEILSFAPLHLMKLEFRLDETTFNYYVKEIEKEISSEHISFTKQENVESIIQRNKEFFSSKGPLLETQRCLENLVKIGNIYTQNFPGDRSIEESVEKAHQQWKNVNAKLESLKQELHQIPEKWETYHQKFDEMGKWMDGVDGALKNILSNVNTMEEFEREKAVFQSICKEADSKREDMKWLVQTLDSLTSRCPEQQAIQEQKNLEALIIRYKNLIPSLEITMVRTDTISKCYTYRREVREVCQLLMQVREQSRKESKPQSLETLSQSINQQEVAITQLDQQRPNIMTLLQKGKELSRDTNAPSFMQDEVSNLESGWTDTYDQTVETLHKLVNTHHLWSTYTEQKKEITQLLTRAEQELKKPPQEVAPAGLSSELREQRQIALHLKDASDDMLRKLKEISTSLTQQVPDQKPVLEKEVQQIEQRLSTTTTNITERIVVLEQYNTTWSTFHTKLGYLHSWTTQEAPQLLSSMEEYAITPEEKMQKVEKLKSEVAQRALQLEDLSKDAQKLLVSDSPEAQKAKSEVIAVKEKVENLGKSLAAQAATVNKDMEKWKTYQSSIQEIKPWIEKAEVKVQLGLPKPTTLEEAVHLQAQTKQFTKEIAQQKEKLQGVAGITQEMSSKSNAPDEVDSMQTRWTTVHETTSQWAQKLDKLVANWVEFDRNVQHLENWIAKSEQTLASHSINVNTPNVDKLEKELADLKTFSNEISEQQAKLISLTQSADSISYSVSPEGAALIKDQVQTLKGRVTQLAEATRAKINEVSDVILMKHDFQKKVADYSNWLEGMKANVAQVDEVPADKVQSTLMTIHSLLQEHSEKQPVFNQLYSEIKTMSLQSPKKETEPILKEYSQIVQQNQEIEHKLQEKKSQLQRWSELLNWHAESSNQLAHIKYQCESEKLAPEALSKLIKETETIIDKVITWKQAAPQIDENQSIIILDKQTSLPRTAENIVREIEISAINVKSQLQDKMSGLEKLKSRWEHFNNVQRAINKDLDNTRSNLARIKDEVKHSSDLPKAVEQLDKLLNAQTAKAAVKEDLRKEAMQLMRDDIQNISLIQNSISEIESNWNKVNEDIKDEKLKLSDIIFAWNEFQEAKDRVVKDIGKIDKSIETLEVPNDLIQANVNCDKAKKALEAIKKSRATLDKAEAKGQAIIKKSEDIPGIESEVKRDLQIVNEAWSKIYERILKKVQTTESQAAIWKHIEESKTTLLQWLSEQNRALAGALEKPNELEAAASILSRYREELPAHQRLHQSIPHKYEQLLKLTENKDVPTLQSLVKLLDDQFKEVDLNAQKLESITSNFSESEKAIKGDIKDMGNKVSSIREEIIKCEDLSGDNTKIVERLLRVRQLKRELQGCDGGIKKIEADIQKMKQNYPTFTESTIPKEHQALKKRYDTILTHSNKIENSLLSFLKKFHNEKYGALQRLIATHREKIQWCVPEATSDKYNLQVKLNALEPIQAALEDCDNRKAELESSIELLTKVESPESIKLLKAEKDHLFLDLQSLKNDYLKTKQALENDISLHDRYEKLSETINNWLKEVENKVKTESTVQMDLNGVDSKIQEILKLQKEVKDFSGEMDKLKPISEQLIKEMPESRVSQYVQHLNSRYQAVDKSISYYLDKLNSLNDNKQLYRDSIKDVEDWLVQAEQKVESFTKIAKKPNQATLEELKKFAGEKERGQVLLSRAVERGEALFPGITPENRDAIRTELRNLRDKSEVLIDKVNSIYKKVEATLMQRHSFDDSLQQVKLWIDDAETKLGEMKLDATLSDKKQTLHNYKILAQDVNLHKNILKQLQEKIGNLSDSEAESKLDENLQKYNHLVDEVQKRIELAEDYVTNHEAYNQAIEKCHDWLSALTSEAALLVDESSSETPEAKLTIVDNLLAQKDEGDRIIASCKSQLEKVVTQTAPVGHPQLINAFEEQEKAWKMFLELCSEAQSKLKEINKQYAEVGKIMESLESWIKSKENQVKDQSLRSSEETKRAHLEKLKSLEKEILTKEPEFNNFTEMIRNIQTDAKVSQLSTRYQSLKGAVKENVNRYESFVREHQDFNREYNEFLHWLSDKEEELQDLCHIVGDLSVLQNRQKQIKDLVEERNQKAAQFENLIEKGEKLYAHTSPDGREVIRQQLRNMRTIWDTFAEDLQNATNKLELCLTQFSDFTTSQEQLTKWLKDVEKAMHQHTELKSTLQEKKAQLQNHKIMHQEIMAHQQLVETVCDKAQQLVDQTQDKSLNMYLQSIKQLFLSIVSKSEELLKNLEECVSKHSNYSQDVAQFKDWLTTQKEKLQELEDIGGEKAEISRRVENLQALKTSNGETGNRMLNELKQKLAVVAKSTAPKGVEILKKELLDIQESLTQHLANIDTSLSNQSNAMGQWSDFEDTLEELNRWFRAIEVKFRDQPLQATLSEKENQLKEYQKLREEVAAKEKEIDSFVDKSHTISLTSGAHRIKPLTSQISNRYHSLHSLTKDVIHRWQGLVDDHKKYQQRQEETSNWLKPLEEHLQVLRRGDLADNAEALSGRLQVLLSEKEQGEHKVNSLTVLGERILPDTATGGREIVRNEMRSIRERWDKLIEGIKEQQKLQDAQSLQLSSYQDMLQQALAWLDSMEKQVKLEPSSWTSIQEVRGKLLKHKTTYQEILSHKRIIEGVTEKAQALIQLTTNKEKASEVEQTVRSINSRYQDLSKIAQSNIKQLEDCLDVYQQFYDLHKVQQDNQKQLWDKLNSYQDYGGNKQVLEQRLRNISDIQDRLPESNIKLRELEEYVDKRISVLPARAQESMKKDVTNLKFDQEKFVAALMDIRSALENRLKQWNDYENTMDRLLSWLVEAELALKNFGLKSTVEEKQEQLEKYQDLARVTESKKPDLKDFIRITDHLEQALILNLRQNEAEFDKMSDDSTELAQSSGDARISANVQQISSRFQAVQVTAKEIIKKCEQTLADHKLYNEKYRQCADWITAAQSRYNNCLDNIKNGSREVLCDQAKVLEELLSQKTSAMLLLNNTVELGEKLYPSTAPEGREIVSTQLQGLQQAMDTLFDEINSTERDLKAKQVRWSGFDECVHNIQKWLKDTEKLLPQDIELKASLDEKKSQLQVYRTLLHDATAHQQDIVDLRDKVDSLPEKNEQIDKQLSAITEQHAKILKRAQNFVERYEIIVSDHQQYSKAVLDGQEWIDATHNTVSMLGDLDLERISLQSNLDRLKQLKASLRDEESRLLLTIKALGDKVIPGTVDYGQAKIRSQIENSQQEWAGLVSTVDNTIQQIESKLSHWSEYEALKDHCLAWIRDTDTKLHSVDLKATAAEKKAQLETLKSLQGEIRAKEFEIDQVTERAQQLNKGLMGRPSQISEIGVKYQQICQKVKDLTSRWQQYVSSHEDFDSQVDQCKQWMSDIKENLSYCSDIGNASQKELEAKLAKIQELLLNKEEGSIKIQSLVELGQSVLANTAPQGHEAINQTLVSLQEEWSNIASSMIETKGLIDDALTKWAGLLEEIKALDKSIEWMENQYEELSPLQSTLTEKKSQLGRIKTLEEKVRGEKFEVDNLKAQASEVLRSKRAGDAALDAQKMLDRFDTIADKIFKLSAEREAQHKDHKTYKEAHDEVQTWMTRAQEKVPQLQRPLSDKLTVEMLAGPLDHLLNKQAQGEVLLENLEHSAQVVIPNTSSEGQEIIRNDIRALREAFDRLFKDLKQQREQLEAVLFHWRDYKDEYERISDWLQQLTILIKNQKIALMPTLEEKEKQVTEVKNILKRLKDGKEQIDKLNSSAKVLLKSPLETHVNNQLQQLNSRYQVELNLAEDVLKKVETNHEQHKEYADNLEKARAWIDNARELIRNCSEAASNSSKETLQAHLDQIQELIQRREEGQSLVHATVNCGEKVLRNTRSDGREAINNELKEIQSDWERIVKKMSTSKVHLETALLQWADYDSSYNQLQQWITDREAKLQQVKEPKVVKSKKGGLNSLPIGERKATLRETSSIVQDIVSFEPMIQSVTSKAEDLKQAAPASEIFTKYETLSKQAQELYAKQKEAVEQHQAFVDAANDFMQWLRSAKERLGKCSEPTGDKESLGSKLSQIKVLTSEVAEGQKKLDSVIDQADKAVQYADEMDKEIIEEEVGLLQEEFDNYVENLNHTKGLLETGIVKWTEYEEQYQDALEWLAHTEKLVQSYNKLQDSLEDKRAVLEQFQLQLQTLFDWQTELDRLNMKAQSLLETCADTRVSNAVTQLSTKYNAILSLAKEVMRRLELHYQEHQQHSALCQECQDWIDRTRDKLNSCSEVPNSLSEINSKLQTVKNIRASLEQGQNKLRYIQELKERVIMNTEQTGTAKIQEDTDNLKIDLDKLLSDVQDVRSNLQTRASQLEEIDKIYKQLLEWLQDQEHQIQFDDGFMNELGEKKAKLEKFKSIQKDLLSHTDLVDKLKSRIGDDTNLTKEYGHVIIKFNKFKEQLSSAVKSLESQVDEHERYKTSYSEASELIRKSQIELQNCSNLHEELDKIIEKEAKVAEISSSLSSCDELIHKTIELSIIVMKTTGEEGKDTIRHEIEQLNTDWEGLQFICNETQKNLERCKDAWKDFKTNYDTMKRCIDRYQKLIEDEHKLENNKPEDLDKVRNLLEELVAQKPRMEDLTDACETLMELSAVGWVRDKTVQIQTEYTNLLTSAQGLVSKVEKNLTDQTEFLKIKEELEGWLAAVNCTIEDCVGEGDEGFIRDKLETVRQVSANLSEGQQLLTKLQDAFGKAINTAASEKQDKLRDDMTTLRNSWDQLNMDLTSIQAQLKAALARWEEFNDSKKRFESWLSEMEKTLQEKPSTRGELSEMKTLLERYKHLQGEITNKQPDLARLQTEATELSSWAKQPSVLEQAKQLEVRYSNLLSACAILKDSVEDELKDYNAYHQKLQDTEKWLLQVSFQLMAHNSLYINNREQTEEQLAQHEVLLGDIQKYQCNLDDVKAKGYGQIEKYVKAAPGIRDIIEKQIDNVQDSYNSLLQTAVQIKNRLVDSLAKFKEYEDTIESIMKNLDEYEPRVMEEVEKPIESLKDAQIQLETAKDLHSKLQTEKSRLAMAVQACEAATASISRPSSPRD
ncbi:unnamed protein product, partial [Callosobruchus maculatus]